MSYTIYVPYTSSNSGTQEFGQFSSPFSVKVCTVQDYFSGDGDRERKRETERERLRETDRQRHTDSEGTRGTRF